MTITRRAVTTISDWLQWRRQYLCASEIGAAIGVDPFRSPLSVYSDKAGLLLSEDSPLMRRGRNLETAVMAYVNEDLYELRTTRPNVFLMDDEYRLGCTPDAIAEMKDGPPGLINLQLKCVARPSFERWDGTPPVSYQLQVATENMMLDATRGILACLVIDAWSAELVTFDIPRHAEAEEKIKEIAREFWQNMDAGMHPSPDYRRDTDTIKQLFPHAVPGEEIDLSADNRLAEILPKRAELKSRVKADIEEIEAIDGEIRTKIGAAERAVLPGWKISCKDQTRKAYTVPESTSRPLRVTEVKGE